MSQKTKTFNYFLEEYHKFRQILCSTKYTIEQKLNAWKGLLYVYVNVETENEKQENLMQTCMSAIQRETEMRTGMELFLQIRKEVNEKWTTAIRAALG